MRNQQYHEIDGIEIKGSRIAARLSSKLYAEILNQYRHHRELDISQEFITALALPLTSAAIVAHLKGARRSFLQADKSFDVETTLELGFKKHAKDLLKESVEVINWRGVLNYKKHAKRITKLPIKKYRKLLVNYYIRKQIEEAGLGDTFRKLEKIYVTGKRVKKEIKKTPVRKVGKKSQIKPVPSPSAIPKKKTFKQKVDRETARAKEEFAQKLKKEKKYLYDEIIRHIRIVLKDVIKETRKAVDWEKVDAVLADKQSTIDDLENIIDKSQLAASKRKILKKIINKVARKIRDKRSRLIKEAKAKGIYEAERAVQKRIIKPVKKSIKEKVEEKLFGAPRKAGSHRQYRGVHYHIAKQLQELEEGQRFRREYEISQRIYSTISGLADLLNFIRKRNIKDVFVLLTELGGATFFPETYKIGGVIKAVNWLGEVAHILEYRSANTSITNTKKYHIDRALRLIQELSTIKKLFSKYYPPVYKILDFASEGVNSNLRQTVNNLILEGTPVSEAKKVLAEALAANGLAGAKPYKIETLYRTQSALAYSAGRFQTDQHPAIQEILWGYKYVTVGDDRVRPAHRVLDGVTLPKDNEFWLYFWPPNGWNCRCQVISIFEERELVYPPDDWKGLAEIDKNFAFNAGLLFTESSAHLAGI